MKKLIIIAIILPLTIFATSVVFVLAKSALLPKPKPESQLLTRYKEQVRLRETSPKVVVPETKYNFGIMDPLTMGEHTFVVRNEGKAPLELELGSTTCKCTFGKLEDSSILPGEAGEVTLNWNTGRKHPYYAHAAQIRTNDPKQRSIHLSVEGLVKVQLGFEPSTIVMPHVEPESTPVAETILFSQAWNSFEITDITSSLKGIRWELQPLEKTWLTNHQAKFGRRLLVTLPADMPQGHFHHQLTLHVLRDGAHREETFDLPLQGKVLRRLSAYGPAVTSDGGLDLGSTNVGTPLLTHVLLKVRDSERDLNVTDIRVTPEFVNVSIEPAPNSKGKGLYVMKVEVPDTSPIGSHTGSRQGNLSVIIDHPRIPNLDLKLNFIVSPR
ncbi:MAG TPA: hypothetical protein DCY79_02630 [Planctomycetaceae bacterium]|nr:hypothetical protein [Blastopirellula sp.]MAR13018.1 hypothetical protein [Blastopirellula sp.]HAY78686.1 hypothetical protein [Planctomycetaceae bacterium]